MSSQPGKPRGIAPLITPDDEMPPSGIVDDALREQEPELYEGFTQSPPPDDALLDAAGGPFVLGTSVLAGPTLAPSDRYVSVRDNQPLFNELTRSLSQARDEFAKDHNRGMYADLQGTEDLKSEIEATLAQINGGRVRKRQLTDGLLPALLAVAAAAEVYPGLKEILQDVLWAVNELLSALGITP